MKKWEVIPKEQLILMIKNSSSYKEALEKIGYSTFSANNKIIKEIAEIYDIDISHYNHTTMKDLKGQRFGRLIVIERDLSKPIGHQHKAFWICRCDCGNVVSVESYNLTKGLTQSCGCLRLEHLREKIKLNLCGKRYGKLTVIKEANDITEPSGQLRTAWECQCDCGNKCIVKTVNLQSGDTSSCGCIYSKGENKIQIILEENKIDYKKEFTFSDLKTENGFPMRFDFAIFEFNKLKCLIEYQGRQHYEEGEFSNAEPLKIRQERDKKKKEYCEKYNIPLIIIPYWDYQIINYNYIKEKINNE